MDEPTRLVECARIEIVADRLRHIGGYRGSFTDAITDATDIVESLDRLPIFDLRDGLIELVRNPHPHFSEERSLT